MRSKVLSFLLLIVMLVTACTPQVTPSAVPTDTPVTEAPATLIPDTATPDTSITIVDALDREVKLAAAPKRIVLTDKALFMISAKFLATMPVPLKLPPSSNRRWMKSHRR